MAKVSLETKFKIDFFLDLIAKRSYPPVFVIDENTEASPDVWAYGQPYDVQIERARKAGVLVLDGMDVVTHLRGEMDPDDEWFLRKEVRWISSAKQGMVIVEDEDPERLEMAAQMNDDVPLTSKMVPVEELLQKDVDQWWFLEGLEAHTHDHPVPFTLPLTDRVQAFIEEHVRQ